MSEKFEKTNFCPIIIGYGLFVGKQNSLVRCNDWIPASVLKYLMKSRKEIA